MRFLHKNGISNIELQNLHLAGSIPVGCPKKPKTIEITYC
jgi:hypothetical protein